MEYAIATLLLMAVAAAIALPLLRPGAEPLATPIGRVAELRTLHDRKLAIYGSIRDLGFDLKTDKLTEDDYDEAVAALKAQAVDVIGRIEDISGDVPRGSTEIERRIDEARASLAPAATGMAPPRPRQGPDSTPTDGDAVGFCTQCGHALRAGDRFCGGCGSRLASP